MSMPSSLQIAQAASLRPITEIGAELGLLPEELELYGPYKAKISLDVLKRLADRPNGHEILITAITPTPLGEGKTTTTIGLAQGLNRIGVRTAVAIRQPSLGPVFGIKGGAAGGGYSQIVPMEDFNLHLTGDNHAVSAAHNLAAAFIDNHLHHGNALGIEPHTISWPHVVDISDRALRHAVIGLGSARTACRARPSGRSASPRRSWPSSPWPRTSTTCARASGASSWPAPATTGPVTLEDLKVAGAMTVLMRDAIKPNLLQTLEGGPAFVHAGPFANIAHGNSSVLADRVALKLVDAVCTEAGFGADMGAQKFMDIKCRLGGIRPSVAVVVATIRALKMHGGVGRIVAGKPLDPALEAEDPEAARRGAANLAKQIENLRSYGVPVVAAINAFPTDAASEVAAVREVALSAGAAGRGRGHALRRRWRRSRGPCPGGLGRGTVGRDESGWLRRRARLPVPLSRRDGPGREDRDHRHPDLRRRWRGLRARRPQDPGAHRDGRPSPAADLHGQDPSLADDRPDQEGPTDRLPGARPGRPALCRGRLRDRLLRRHADDARPALAAGGRGRRHRRRRQRRRAVLIVREPSVDVDRLDDGLELPEVLRRGVQDRG